LSSGAETYGAEFVAVLVEATPSIFDQEEIRILSEISPVAVMALGKSCADLTPVQYENMKMA
jgi:hypothetical protein